jgi:hypothetical protein
MKRLLVIAVALCVSACEPYVRQVTAYPLPPALADCQVYQVSNGEVIMSVIHCPHADTHNTYSSGKTTQSVSVITEPAPVNPEIEEIKAKIAALEEQLSHLN